MKRGLIAAAAAVLFTLMGAQAEDDCRLKRMAALDLTPGPGGGHVLVQVQVNGQPLNLVVDTGSNHTMLTERAAHALGLRFEAFPNSTGYMWGGFQLKNLVTADSLQLGKLSFDHSTMYVIPDADMHTPGYDGLLGSDILARFDVDFDFANGKLNLIAPHPCSDKVAYWAEDSQVSRIPFRKQASNIPITDMRIDKIYFVASLDGKDELAVLDTGAPITSLDLDVAERDFDLKPDTAGMQKIPRLEGSYGYTFKGLTFGGVTVTNPKIRLDPYARTQISAQSRQMIIGMNVLRQLHLYIAYRERMLYVTGASAHK
jgi:predicted aspartyl protease